MPPARDTPPRASTRPPAAEPPPPPPAAPATGARLHDGFFLRLGLGLPVERVTVHDGNRSYRISNDSLIAIDLAIGGTPLTGLVLAVDLSGFSSSSPSVSGADSASREVSKLSLTVIAAMVDWYPYPTRGYHVLGYGGLASIRIEQSAAFGIASQDDSTGGAFGAGAGWETFTSDQWSLGFLVRGHVATTDTKTSGSVSSAGAEVLVGFTHH